jgi:hypothetical protein
MPTQVWRPGDYRVCPSCGSRHKVQDLRCTHCNTVLAGTPIRHASAPVSAAASVRSGRGLRAALAVGVLLALASGLWVRSLFRGAAIEDAAVQASSATAPVPLAEPSFTPPVLNYPPVVGYGGVPPNMAALTIAPSPLPASPLPMTTMPAPVDAAVPQTGMTAIAPPSQPTRKTTFTDADLSHAGMPSAVASVPAAAAPRLPASAATYGPTEDDVQKWTSRLRDREDDVREAQGKVRRIEAEAAVSRARAEAMAGDPDARDKARRETEDALADLEKAERKLAEKQRELDETKQEARSAGLRFEN